MSSMKRRLSLAISRLTIFLAIVAWIVSQRYVVDVSSPVVAAVIVPDGWAGGLLHDSSTTWNFRIRNVGESGLDDNLFSYPFPAMGPSSGFNVPGLTGHQYTEVSILAVRHWLVIALLIASHAVLRLLLWRRLALDKRHETATNAT